MRWAKRLLALAVVVSFVGFWAASAQGGSVASVDKVGWWSRRPAAQPMPNETTFEVAHGAQGDESVAAVRVRINGTVNKATLVLTETSAPLAGVATPKLQVCDSDSTWLLTAHNPGKWEEAPKPDCAAAVPLTRNDKGEWTADITTRLLGARSEISLMIVPAEDPAAVVPPTYFLSLEPRLDAEGELDESPTTPSAAPARPSTYTPPSISGGSSSPAISSLTPATTPTSVTAAPTPTTAVASDANNSTVPRRLSVTSPATKKEWGKLFVLVPLAFVGAVVYMFARKFTEQREILADT